MIQLCHVASDLGLKVTNASGALSPEYAVGDVVVLGDVRLLSRMHGNHSQFVSI